MDGDLVVDDLQPADHEAVRTLVLNGLAERWGCLDPACNDDLAALGTRRDSERTVVVRLGGVIAATGTISRRGREAEIRRMSVAVDRRRRGLARAIVAELVGTARRWGVGRVVLETTSTWAVALYRSCGFVVTHVDAGDTWFALDLLRVPAPNPRTRPAGTAR
ncbi:MAG: GNAT family N-acetyltransferase [Ilumatobacteraceae bacterium]